VPENDKSSIVTIKLGKILDACTSAENKLKNYLVETDVRPDIYADLFHMLNSVDDILEMVSPSKKGGEFFGLSHEQCEINPTEKIEFSHVERPGWDFTAWFGEKSSSLKWSIKKLIEYYELDTSKLKFDTEETTPRKFVKEQIDYSLSMVRHYSQLIFGQVFDDLIEIKTVSK
jgi:hypothetical protein